MEKIVLFTGGFDPIHSGHIQCINESRDLGRVVIGLNSDEWLTRKKGRPFMPFAERKAVIEQFKSVDAVIGFDDSDGSACDAIRQVLEMFPDKEIIFANGGDRTSTNIPEMDRFHSVSRLSFQFGVGGSNKSNSSSWILEEWKAPKTPRQWGYYRVLHEVPGMKVKELTVEPGKSLSMQRHEKRAEYWIVSEGTVVVNSMLDQGYHLPPQTLTRHMEYHVPLGGWHQLTNPFDVPAKIVEIQYGNECIEDDILRL